ncbi:bis(5'-nucleosyl)-tetraphosphatase PrpE [Bacillus piscicola]|uniref:bis(5'-nucleosyl)-tetraphosphatase PrpE n=1 Tax=Bacillus piscicola TaxID=1632684 RepID=UPI001F090EDF|nr:bis(5'-nucleosyl)-tetraphosphatase PrpE [Bacillus piscicola]
MPAYDFIGDIHGCMKELTELFQRMNYRYASDIFVHPDGRIPVFIGDLTDRGPNSTAVIQIVAKMVEKQVALYVPGNHCNKLYRYFLGRNVQITHGLETTVAELKELSTRDYKLIRKAFVNLYESSPLYLLLDDQRVVAAHAGIREDLIGRTGNKVKTFVLYGDITGATNPDGTPLRRDWALQYQGESLVVYGHTPVTQPRMIGNTVNIDTGCVFGGKLTAFHYPEKTFSFVPSSLPVVPEKFRTFPDTPARTEEE